MAVGAVSAVALLTFTIGPAVLRHALSALFVISRSLEAAAPYRIEVTPGNATVPKGADQTIAATLAGFDSADAAIVLKKGGAEAAYERVAMLKGENGTYEGLLFDLDDHVEYFVEAAGVRSPAFTLKVVELPYVKKLDLEYRFPAYTGLEPRKVEDGGDIAVLGGTDVSLTITPTMTSKGGRILIGEKESVPLTAAADGTLTAAFTAKQDGFYRVELDGPSGEKVTASPQYTIDILERSDADGHGREARSRHRRHPRPGVRDRGAGRRRLRGEEPRADVFGQRWPGEEHPALRRASADERSDRRPHLVSRGARGQGG